MEQIPLKWDGKQCGIYCIKNLKNGKVYIGSSKNCYHRVRSQHFDKLQKGTHHNPHLQSSWNKYGKVNFESFCVELCDSNVLSDKEQGWIDKTNCLDPKIGYNINPYADRIELTEEQCRKISLAKLGIAYIDGKSSGINRIANRGGSVVWTVVVSFQNKEVYAGTFCSKKIAERIRLHVIKCLRNNKEIDWSWINKYRLIHKKKIIQKTIDNKVVRVFDSMKQAFDVGGFYRSGIRLCCNGKQQTYKGFLWEYVK